MSEYTGAAALTAVFNEGTNRVMSVLLRDLQ